jgi:hypothetical protein
MRRFAAAGGDLPVEHGGFAVGLVLPGQLSARAKKGGVTESR